MVGFTPQQYETYLKNWAELKTQLRTIQERFDRFQNPFDHDFVCYESHHVTLREISRALESLCEYLKRVD